MKIKIGLISDNGIGLGHITRLLAVATRLNDEVEPVFLSMSESHALVGRYGFESHYLPSRRKQQVGHEVWNQRFQKWIEGKVADLGLGGLIVDHINPPNSFEAIAEAFPKVYLAWLRRGLWKAGTNQEAVGKHVWFDRIFDIRDIGSMFDRGATKFDAIEKSICNPVSLIDSSTTLSFSDSRDGLGIGESEQCVLLKITDNSPHKLDKMNHTMAEYLIDSCGIDQVVIPTNPLHPTADSSTSENGIRIMPLYPAMRYAKAFDFCISSAGYNSVHEVIATGTPSALIPHAETGVDDQALRSTVFERYGLGRSYPSVQTAISDGLGGLLNPTQREHHKLRIAAFQRENGAIDICRQLESDLKGLTR